MGDDLDWEQMQKMLLGEGVRKLGDPKQRGGKARPKGPSRGPTPPSRAPAKASKPTPPPSLEALRARREADALTAKLAERDAKLADLQAAHAELTRSHGSLEEAHAALQAELEARGEALDEVRSKLDAVRAERGELRRALTEAEAALKEAPTLESVLTRRGLEAAEIAGAVRDLLDLHAVLTVAALRPGPELAGLVEDRVQLLCGRTTCPADPHAVVVTVPRRRCDICAGSDLRVAFTRWVEAAAAAECGPVTIVGGSPNYRKQLRGLVDELGGPRLNLVPGTKKRDARKVASDIRGSDVVVLWGGTLLDHALSNAYRGAGDKRLQVGDRGMTRMLDALRRRVAG